MKKRIIALREMYDTSEIVDTILNIFEKNKITYTEAFGIIKLVELELIDDMYLQENNTGE